jgi:hypothetical protein
MLNAYQARGQRRNHGTRVVQLAMALPWLGAQDDGIRRTAPLLI